MNSQAFIKSGLIILFYVALQLLFIRNLVVFNVAFCFVYIVAILWLPGELDSLWVILISFLIGLSVDVFYNTAGVHASACTLIGFLRKGILQYFFPSKGIDSELDVSLVELGYRRYLLYVSLMVFIHHMAMFFVEAGGFHLWLHTLLKIFSSLFFTVFVIYLISLFTSNLAGQKD